MSNDGEVVAGKQSLYIAVDLLGKERREVALASEKWLFKNTNERDGRDILLLKYPVKYQGPKLYNAIIHHETPDDNTWPAFECDLRKIFSKRFLCILIVSVISL